MKPLRGAVWGCALVLLGTWAPPVHAAWCNVFQATCFHCRQKAVSSYHAPAACCDPCPQQCCTTCYVQRCYYQPVVSYQTRTYYEPVTTYRTSYYYEPVTSYRYSCYYDPCTCSYQQVACPTTSYRLRSQCCPVQSWVQRCCSVPVTSYQQAFYWEPVTTCTPAAAAAPPAQDCGPLPQPGAATQAPPGISEPRRPSGPAIDEYPNRNGNESLRNQQQRYYPVPDGIPPASGSSYRQLPAPTPPPSWKNAPPAPLPAVRLDRITAAPAGQVQGQVVRSDNQPWAGARILFVSADRRLPRQTVDTDRAGQFQVSLDPGGWLVYLQDADGRPTFQKKIDVRDNEKREMTLVSR
jgi:hypothetical protein